MKRCQANKFRLEPNEAQKAMLAQFAGCCRKVWNDALALADASLAANTGYIGYYGYNKALQAWKADPDKAFLRKAPSQSLQQTLMNLEKAFKVKQRKATA